MEKTYIIRTWYSLSNACGARLLSKASTWLRQTSLLCCMALPFNNILWSLTGQTVTIWARLRAWENRWRSWQCELRSLSVWLLSFSLTRNILFPTPSPDKNLHNTSVQSCNMPLASSYSTYLTNSLSNTKARRLSSAFSLSRRWSRQKLQSSFSSWKKSENVGQTYFLVLSQDGHLNFRHNRQFFLVFPHFIMALASASWRIHTILRSLTSNCTVG